MGADATMSKFNTCVAGAKGGHESDLLTSQEKKKAQKDKYNIIQGDKENTARGQRVNAQVIEFSRLGKRRTAGWPKISNMRSAIETARRPIAIYNGERVWGQVDIETRKKGTGENEEADIFCCLVNAEKNGYNPRSPRDWGEKVLK